MRSLNVRTDAARDPNPEREDDLQAKYAASSKQLKVSPPRDLAGNNGNMHPSDKKWPTFSEEDYELI